MKNKIRLFFRDLCYIISITTVILGSCGIDSIYDNGYFIHFILLWLVPLYIGYKLTTKEERKKIFTP